MPSVTTPLVEAFQRTLPRLVVLIAAAIFGGDMALHVITAGPDGIDLRHALGQSIALTAIVCPLVLLVVIRPLERNLQRQQTAEAALEDARLALEERVEDRTRELEEANATLAVRAREMTLLTEMSELIQASIDGPEVYAIIARYAEPLLGAKAGAIYVFSASRDDLEVQVGWGGLPSGTPDAAFGPHDCWSLRRGRAHEGGRGAVPVYCHHVPHESGPYLCLPLMAQGETLGVLHLSRLARDSADVTILATTFADHIALSLANLRLRERLENQSVRDPLTGLFNRRYLEETLEREVLRARRSSMPVAVVMLDLDHFKRLNDTFGHAAGDQVLKEVSAYLRTQLRGDDIACRYGGEEFVLVLPDTDAATAVHRMDDIRSALKRLPIELDALTLPPVSCSMGIAVCPEHGDQAESLLGAADVALYQAKDGGRDRVVLAEGVAAPVA